MAVANPFLDVLAGDVSIPPPVWMMRQAGRYLPEYREIRAKAESFLHFCYTPAFAVEATLQPIKRFDLDAAILFSDILVIPDALGQKVTFEMGEGPRLDAIESPEGCLALRRDIDLERLKPVFEAIGEVRASLAPNKALIGFCGAPWTVASYMIAGRGTPDQAPARLFAYRYPDAFAGLIDRLVDASTTYLIRQFEAGVDAVQIFDSWSGVLPVSEFERWCLAPLTEIARRVKAAVPDAPIIAFPRGCGTHLVEVARLKDLAAVGLDTSVDPEWVVSAIPNHVPVQGNLDPLALLAGGRALEEAVLRILQSFEGRPHIFNLGHGILPPTPIAHVEAMLALVRGKRS